MFNSKELIERVDKLTKTVDELDIKYHRVCTAFAKHLNISLIQRDVVKHDWFLGKKIDYEYDVVPLKKEKKTIKKKNKKSKK